MKAGPFMRKRKQAEETNDELCSVAEKEFPLAEMLVDALSQNGIKALAVGSNGDALGALHGTSRLYERVFVRREDLAKAMEIADELFGDDLDR